MEFLLRKASGNEFVEDKYTDDKFINEFHLPKEIKTKVDKNNWGEKILYIEIDNLEDLLKIGKKIKNDIIIDADNNEILIYDDYIE